MIPEETEETAELTSTEQEASHAQRLRALCEAGGVLRIITNEHACGAGKHPSIEGFNSDTCVAFAHDLRDPRHFVIHDVIDVQGPDHKGNYRALSAEGDWTYGRAHSLIVRLQEANQVAA